MKDNNRNTQRTPWFGFVLIFSLVVTTFSNLLPPASLMTAAAQGSFSVYLPCIKNGNPAIGSDWNQEGGNPQHTGYTAEQPGLPWTLAWTWNGPDSNGGPGGHFYDAPRNARTITGGNYVFVPAGEQGIFALTKSSGSMVWNFNDAAFNATPAYDRVSRNVLVGGADGILYKLSGRNGDLKGTYDAGSPLNRAVLLANGWAYVTAQDGSLHKVNINSMSVDWVYQGYSEATLPPALSSSGVVVYGTADLYVHGVDDLDGSQAWRVKPTNHTPSDIYTYDGYWPVIAEQHGIVFIRLNLGMEALWSGPGCGMWGCGIYPSSNAEVRNLLLADGGELQNLFALSLSDGSEAFVPAVGFGGVEGLDDSDSPILENGPMPVIKVLGDGSEVAYIPFRSGQGNPQDGRWDTHLGEMVLDNSTVPGLQAGDLRFVHTGFSTNDITDEQTPLSMAGDTLFIAHWGASMSLRIDNRSDGLGLNHGSPIQSTTLPTVIRRQAHCGDYDPDSHWTSCGLTLYSDGRYWTGPGFWTYWNVYDPPTPPRGAYSEGILPRYTYVSGGLIIVEGNGGELMAFHYTP